MSKARKFKVTREYDNYGRIYYEKVNDENGDWIFDVTDLTETPEDATIDRDLFNTDDYIHAVEFGMELAKAGYDEIEVEREEE